MSVDVIIDADILTQGEVHINKGGVSITNFNIVQNTDVHINNICVINCSELNIGSHVSKQLIHEIENLVTNYRPIKTKSTNSELHIQLLDHTPVFQNLGVYHLLKEILLANRSKFG